MATQQISPTSTADDTDIDPETIQSTVDMSLSLALSLVQSWMPPASSNPLDPSIVQSRKRVEESMRRPPRLGVGAPMPTAQHNAPTHHETQRLKNRLVGSGATRRKAEEETKVNGVGSQSSKSKRHNDASDDEDESESRTSAMKKKTKGMNGLSVFGAGNKGLGTKSKAGSEVNASARPVTVTAEISQDTSEPTPAPTPAPLATPASESSVIPSSTPAHATTSESKSDSTSDGAEHSSHILPARNEPMGIHKLPPKLPLSAKIWPRSGSPPVSDSSHHSKRRKTAPMLPPPSPVVETWSMQLPKLPPSSSRSASVASSSVPSSSAAVEPRLDSTARLSRKERKRLRKAAQQYSASQEVKQEGGIDRESERSDVRAPMPLDADSTAHGVKGASAQRIDEPDTDESESDEEPEVVSRIVDEKIVTQNDTVQDGGKKKRKRRARKKSGPG